MTSVRSGLAALFALVAAVLSGCAGDRDAPEIDLATAPATLGAGYRLAAGEKLKITVFGEPDMSGVFEVGPRGTVSLPLVGEVRAEGGTLEAFRSRLSGRLASGYVNAPKVAVEIAAYRPIYVHGEVRTGGEFPFKAGARIRDAIAMAGGYSYRAEESYVLLTRPGSDGPRRVPVTANLMVFPGDNIRVPERFF
ncbi:MAG: polysaccharide biosynthesis/export family protein [Hyphomicrobiaceae bacterium]